MGNSLPTLLSRLKDLRLPEEVNVLIVVQRYDERIDTSDVPEKITIVNSDSIGLSRSRNIALANVDTDYIWFLDDDVLLRDTDLVDVQSLISERQANFYRVQIGCIEYDDRLFKHYKPMPKVRVLNLLQFSSIEIIADLKFIKQNHIRFNENIGLGTKFPANEENNFLLDAWQKGATFEFVPKTLVLHTCNFENRILATDSIFEIRGATASRFGVLGIVILIRWLLRFGLKYRKLSYLKSMVRGFFNKYASYR